MSELAGYDSTLMASLDFHQSMLTDRVRTESFMRAVMAAVKPGDVVIDIGTGTGVLALFAAKAGARRVYAIERDPVIELAERIVAANGYEDRVVLIPDTSTDVVLPELGDVLVTETIGNAGLDEGIMRWIHDARKRLLRPGATIIPAALSLQVVALELLRDWAETRRWGERMHSLDFAPLHEAMFGTLFWDEVSPVSVVSDPVEFFYTDFGADPEDVDVSVSSIATRDATMHALGLWFSADLGWGITISNAPPSPVPSWHQGVLMLEEPVSVGAGQALAIELSATSDGRSWSWRVNESARQSTALFESKSTHG